mgnify:CR=1 FL=1
MKRKFLCLLLALTMVLGLAATVSADEEIITSGDWTYRAYGEEAVLCSYNGTATEITVPATIDGLPVTELGWGLGSCFSGVADTLKSVTIEDGIPLINNSAFKNCTALTKIEIPSSVTFLGFSAFEGCTSLSEVIFNEGLKSIGRYAFLNTALTSVVLPASVTVIEEDSLGYTGEWGDTDQVEGFTIYGYTNTGAEEYARKWHFNFVDLGGNYDNSGRCGDSLGWKFTAATGTLLIYGPPGSSGGYMNDYDEDEIPWAIHKPFIKNVVMECGMDIASYAFQDCTNLTTVTMPDTVEDIRSCAFKNTPKLTSVKLSANLDFISTNAFSHSGLTAIELPESLTGIGTHAFEFTPLTSIEIPDSVEFSQGAFYQCTALASVKLPADLEEINPLLFQGCTSLKTIDLPETITVIGRQAFSGSGLTSIEIPDGVTVIGENAFYECLSLEYVKLPASLEEAGWRCFQDCDKLSTIVMPEGITTNFGQWFFLSCDSLTDIDFHTAPTIGFAMYQNCAGLTNLTIPACVTTIGDNAFAYCENLSYVTIPASVTEFGAKPFHDCPKLKALAFRGDAPAFHEFAFEETTVTCYYPADNATWTEEVRQNYGGTITWIPYEVLPFTDVPANAFYYNPVKWALEKKITAGVSDTLFGSADKCNRAQAVTFLWSAAGKPEPTITSHPFTDVPAGSFCEKAVLWALEKNITSGTDETHFSPLATCNRATIVTFLYKALGSPELIAAENPFEDIPDESWYTAPVLWAKEAGITSGTDATHFSPASLCNRAQMVTFLYSAYNK